MIYLILDTNIWLYIVNEFDSISRKISIESNQHINVFERIKSKTESGEFKILVNEIILNEWVRNKAVAFQPIKELEKRQKEKIAELV